MVTLLMDQGANLSYQNEYGNTALHEAVLNDHHSVVKEIVSKKGINLNQVNNAGETPLIIASKNGKEVLAIHLAVDGGASMERSRKDINGKNALDYAQSKNYAILARILTENGIFRILTENYGLLVQKWVSENSSRHYGDIYDDIGTIYF